MAQTEDTELRDLVIEALEKNGSLSKIRALLRANIFLAFEDEPENVQQNPTLEKILSSPEGMLSLSIIHEFLEFCNLKNTLFVYMAESRQGKQYVYEGRKMVLEKLNLIKKDNVTEPILIMLLKSLIKPLQRKYFEQGDTPRNPMKFESGDNNNRDEQNCTYIVHEDLSSTTSQSTSDNSSDERNKLHLRLQLDHSDTDTSSDSMRDKHSSEYIPSEHIVKPNKSEVRNESHSTVQNEQNKPYYFHEPKVSNSSDSTSYVEITPYKSIDNKGTGLSDRHKEESENNIETIHEIKESVLIVNSNNDQQPKVDSAKSATLGSISSISSRNDNDRDTRLNIVPQDSGTTDVETAEYSLDFTSSPVKDKSNTQPKSPESVEDSIASKNFSMRSPQQSSQSSQSSISISDVADLIEYSEKDSPFGPQTIIKKDNGASQSNKSNESSKYHSNKLLNNDSGDSSESSIPSLSNLSLDIHSN